MVVFPGRMCFQAQEKPTRSAVQWFQNVERESDGFIQNSQTLTPTVWTTTDSPHQTPSGLWRQDMSSELELSPVLWKKHDVFVFYCWDFSLMKNDFNGVKWETQSHQWRIISVKKSISVKSSSSAVKIFFICRRYLRRILSFCSRWHIPHSVLF